MLTFAAKYGHNVYSQFGEDGILQEVVSRLRIKKGLICEFGAHDGSFCSNSKLLIHEYGWYASLIEADPNLYRQCCDTHLENDAVWVKQAMVLPSNVNSIVPMTCDILCIDVDGIDAAIWQAYIGEPKVVVIEINSSVDPLSDLFADPEKGSSYKSMFELGYSKGYFLLCHTANMIFVKLKYMKLFPEVITAAGLALHPISNIELFFNTAHR